MIDIFFSAHFKKQLKKLKRKYPHVKEDLLDVIESFDAKNEIHIGKSIYKIRISSRDMQKGKSGGFRSYIYIYVRRNTLLPLCIYPKSETESITENELEYHLTATIKEVVENL